MSFLIPCPHCGERDVNEFRYGGEKAARPTNPDSMTPAQWAHYTYDRKNIDGTQSEWWYHRMGCRQWFLAQRDTVKNTVEKTWLSEEGSQAAK
jgi:heterotetrameric sarcosine oxidase delta subunit